MTEGRVFSIDVECVASGPGHNDRVVGWVAVVDEAERTVLNEKVRVEGDVFSYLTPITGLKEDNTNEGISLEDVSNRVRALLNPSAILVGQSVQSDIDWLNLVQGEDFGESVDLAELFSSYNPKYKNTSRHSLRHEARVLLNIGKRGSHDPADDARSSVRLYNQYGRNCSPEKLRAAQKRLRDVRPEPSIAKQYNWNMDGVCMAKFYKQKCVCGQPTN